MKLKHLTLGALLWLGAASAAFAQAVNTVPQVGVISAIQKQPTYTASSVGLVPASSATDIWCISPGASRNISIRSIKITGTAGTAVTTPFLVYRRVSLDTGGTPATSLALPVAAKLNPADGTSTATLVAYTANPTVVDSSPVLMDVIQPTLAVTTTANAQPPVTAYGETIGWFTHGLILQKNTTQQVCVNLNGVTVSSGVLNITAQWVETP